jgi:substrate import-associated zinc metallohydrolase lipoprotein
MKKLHVLLFAFLAYAGINAVVSCSEDDLGPTIFPAEDKPLDRTLGTFPLDTFVKKHMLERYNMKYIYRMEDVGADMQKNLVPARYEKSLELAILTKYLWLDVYDKLAGEKEVFLKKYAPRIIHVIGSPAYNEDGSRTVGVAEGGVKITLMEANKLNVNEIEGPNGLNNLFFHTMHHEFAHILDQTYQRPTEFDLLSQTLYDGAWNDKHDSVQASLGFVTPYGSSANREDWVEVMSCYITYDNDRWNRLLNSSLTDWEDVEFTLDSFQVRYPRAWEEQSLVSSGLKDEYTLYDRDSVGYLHELSNGEYKLARKVIKRDADGYAQTDTLGNCILDREHWDNIDGHEIILTKVNIVRNWLRANWDIDLDALRQEVQQRQYMTDENGVFVRDEYGNYVNRLIQPYQPGSSKTLFEYLNEEVDGYKAMYEEAIRNK